MGKGVCPFSSLAGRDARTTIQPVGPASAPVSSFPVSRYKIGSFHRLKQKRAVGLLL
jgi:hypothetical protein